MKNYRYILFDADDTLLDFRRCEREALASSLSEADLNLDLADCLTQYTAINRALWLDFEQNKVTQAQLRSERFRRLFVELGIEGDSESFGAIYLRHFAAGSFLTPDALAICDALKPSYDLSIITNGVSDVQFSRISGSELKDHFDHIIVSDDAGFAKPAPEIFDYALRKIGCVDKSEVLIVGDSLSSDIRGGHNYGIDTCWYNPELLENGSGITPTYEIEKLTELLELLPLGSRRDITNAASLPSSM
ncbi:YjjG family noncanonical pyrimidine nucleotidase [Saccharibacillus kuerlensis]|uniref:Noncanonical pyrimidine nucleotidase, YjjG family protein n=1 Tax=Saccharibacillus kuerlensis TaxID=459527 RepID=A0ABQ2KRD7_9BACL|nr:YjjG family noncanonical pyrimidine nucleotidase [Saccharibacillus kuerlensis]GGN90802.1 noncanonical pyrimidine nucleotidase, YjjG family protein [Saccharibacillus kuerlensis]